MAQQTENAPEVNWTDEKISRIWNYYAGNPAYATQYFSLHSGPFILSFLRKRVPFAGARILDFGCGPGHLLGHLLGMTDGRVSGLDFSPTSVEAANRAHKGRSNFGGVVLTESLPSPYATSSMDVIVSIEVIEHLTDSQVEGTLKEAMRLLKPGGYLVVTTPNDEDLEANKTICPDCGTVFHRWQHMRKWSAATLRPWLERAGFRNVALETTNFRSKRQALTETIFNVIDAARGRGVRPATPHLVAICRKDP